VGEGVSFNEDENLGLPLKKHGKPRGMSLSGLIMKLGLAKTQTQVDIILIIVLIITLALGAYIVMSSSGPTTSVSHKYDPSDPALKSMTHQPTR
jgi:hypothetical protein